jgi:alpha-ketoglutarate-dependent taurine dioxygenase
MTTPKLPLFRTLGQTEEEAFRLWARENYQPLHPINGIWHPVVQDECVRINRAFTAEGNSNT